MDSIETADLIIVGAGPAGLATAMHLVQNEPSWVKRLIILEKSKHPRAKLCGGGVTRFGLRALRELGFELPLPIPHARVDNVYLKYRNRTIHVRGKPLFNVFNRPEFDHFLVQEARKWGISIHENEAVKSLHIQQDHVLLTSVKGTYQSKMVVGADGALGLVRVSLRDKAGEKRIARTLEVSIPAALNSPRFIKRSAFFDFTYLREDLQGYFWDFPSFVGGKPAFNQGIYDSRAVPQRPRADLRDLLVKGMASVGTNLESTELNGAPIHWFSPSNRMSGHRFLLVGDAAGVEVLFGEGISPALGYGKVAANEIIKAFQTNNFGLDHYQQNVMRSPLGYYLLIRWLLASNVYNLGNRVGFMHVLWTAGQILATIWHAHALY